MWNVPNFTAWEARVWIEETLSYVGDLMFKIQPFIIPNHPFAQEAVALSQVGCIGLISGN